MVFKMINAVEAKVGVNILVENIPCTVKKMDISKTGKHGHAKCRIEAVGILDDKKKVFVMPGHDKLEVPIVEKKKAQVLSIGENSISVMDLESFETIEVICPEELKGEIGDNDNVEYWNVQGTKVIKRKM